MPAPNMKSDDSFLAKVSMGATAVRAIMEDLQGQGLHPIELERGAAGWRIWRDIKIKRIRVPDILCLATGQRVESRAKGKLELSMSHSTSTPERAWDFGMDDEDVVAIRVCNWRGPQPTDWEPDVVTQYVSVGAMREAVKQGLVEETDAKGSQEGFEKRIVWPCTVALADGVVKSINHDRIQITRASDQRTISYRLVTRAGVRKEAIVEEGDAVLANQVLASVVPIHLTMLEAEPVDSDYYRDLLTSKRQDHRYAAAKALGFSKEMAATPELKKVANDADEHIYVRIEAAAALVRLGLPEGLVTLKSVALGEPHESALESIIILGELNTANSLPILVKVACDPARPVELRAGACWSLGRLGNAGALDALISCFEEQDDRIRHDAARALARVASAEGPEQIMNRFADSSGEALAGIAWALGHGSTVDPEQLEGRATEDEQILWLPYVFAHGGREHYASSIVDWTGDRGKIAFATFVLWQIMESWISEVDPNVE